MLMRPNPGKVRWPWSLCVALAVLCSVMPGLGVARADDPAPAACTITALDTTGLTGSGERAPNLRNRYARSVYLILPEEMAAAGIAAGTSFTAIGWSFEAAPGLSGSGPLTVYMQNTTDETNTKSTDWATVIAGMTVVHNDLTTIPNVIGPFDIPFVGGSPFTYDGGGLYIAFDEQYPTGDLSTQTVEWLTPTLPGGDLLSQFSSPPTSLLPGTNRPLTRLTPSTPAQLNDASVDVVYSLGSLAVPFSGPQAIQAVITNKGANALANLPVTLNVTGAESFTDSQVVPALAACGGQTTVTFAPFTPSVIGSDTLTVSVPADELAANNSKSNPVDVTNNLMSYKEPGSTPTNGVSLGTLGANMNTFRISAPGKITGVNLEFVSSIGASYRVVIYPDSGSGTPALFPVYEDSADRTVAANGPVSINIPTPVAVSPGTYYAGYEQTTASNVFITWNYEFPERRGSIYYALALPVTAWTEDVYDPNNLAGGSGFFRQNIGITLAQCTAASDCDDANPCTDDSCDSGTGLCVHANKADGASCSDGNACTQTDTCQAGTCVGSNPVTCAALDQCHVAGTCNPANGVCSNPAQPDGTSCNDGNACTLTDRCVAGTCTGSNDSWSGFLQPVNADGTSVFKLGSTIPVKFSLTGACAGNTNLIADIYFYQVTNSSGPVNEAESTSAADTGTLFRYSGGQYIFNLGTKGLTEGTWQLGVDLHDGTGIRSIPVGLRK